jgi:predicted metalloprotease with PDZ domain
MARNRFDGAATMRIFGLIAMALLLPCAQPVIATHQDASPASYRVRVIATEPLRLAVDATLPSSGDRLNMSTTRPGDIPQLDAGGWPAIVVGLEAKGADGQTIAAATTGADGWRLSHAVTGPIAVHYEIDYAPLAKLGWPAPRESVYADDEAIVLAGRSLFVSTPTQTTSRVRVEAPSGWHVATPWQRDAANNATYRVESVDGLVDNLFALSKAKPGHVVAGRFGVGIVAIGSWQAVRDDVARIVDPIAKIYVRMMPVNTDQAYLIVLLPQHEHGGESFRNSFAMNFDAVPSHDNRADWGNTLAHEIFHYWNGWRLRGADYMATQWFQEGFTEYMANKALLAAGLITPDEFLRKLAKHFDDYKRLATPLDAPGSHKGPPLYGGGALVAFCWDVQLREASSGHPDLRDVFAALWKATDRGAKEYDWNMIRDALVALAKYDWTDFHTRYIAGREPVPVDEALRTLGLKRTAPTKDGEASLIAPDEAATAQARKAWSDFVAR